MNAIEQTLKLKVWQKAMPVQDYDPDKYRKDENGAWIAFDDYGNTESNLGWMIEPILGYKNLSLKNINKLRPIHWESSNTYSTQALLSYTNINI